MNNKIEEQAELRAIVEGFFSKSMLARSPTKVDMLVQELSEHTAKQKEKWEKYQTHIHFIRTLSTGKEIWGVRIGYQAQTIYSDIADSEEQAKEKLATELAHLSSKEQGSHNEG